jgi:glycosyltransferase involved in cell wall biosynthesis
MNILFISSIQMWGGGEVWLMDIMSGLRQRGHAVSLICRPNTELAEKAHAAGYDVTTMRIGGDFDPFVIWKTFRVMRRKKIQVVCTNMDKDLRFGGIAAKLAGVSGIVPSREIDYPLKNKWRYRFAYNFLASKIVVNSDATLRTVLQSAPWLKRERTKVIYKGIDLSLYDRKPEQSLAKELSVANETPIVAFIGQLDERKGIQYLLEAWCSVRSVRTDAVLVLAGTGPLKNYIERFIKVNGIEKSVRLLGFRMDIPSVLRQSTMLVLPSLWEGFGYVLIEAMAATIPVVATSVSSIPEIVEHKKSGILVEPQNSAALAQAIVLLLADPVMQRVMGLAGRRIAEEKFTVEKMVDEFERTFLAEAGTQ